MNLESCWPEWLGSNTITRLRVVCPTSGLRESTRIYFEPFVPLDDLTLGLEEVRFFGLSSSSSCPVMAFLNALILRPKEEPT